MKSRILPIAEDASFRKFYRLISSKSSKIIVLSNREKYKNLVAYTAINKFLRANKMLAPKLYGYNFSKGIIVIQDFGNFTFYKILIKKTKKLFIYKKLVDLLIEIQKINPKFRVKNVGYGTHKIEKYSNKYLFKESDLFFDWYLPLILNKKKSSKIKKKSKKILKKLYNKLNYSELCFVHRDYHSQNLMKVGKKIGVIDSQDALIGNPAYDLVSLIDDARIRTSVKLKKQIYDYYIKKKQKIYEINRSKFLEDFNILSVQRSLKIIGIFARLFKRDKKSRYLKLIPYTWKLLEMRMNFKVFIELKKILDKNISKKKRKKIIIK